MLTDEVPPPADRTYRQRGAETRGKKTTAAVVAAAERVLVDHLLAHPTEPLSRLTMAKICKQGEITKATMSRRFKTVEAVCAAVAEKMRAEDQEVPAQIAELAERHARDESWKDESSPERMWLAARLGSKDASARELEEGYESAQARGDRTEMLYWCTELVERCYADSRREFLNKARKALYYAEIGLSLVDPGNAAHCRMGFRITQTAARAELLLSTRDLDYEMTGLSRIRSLKDTEIQFAKNLGWKLRAELAKFHRDRSAALCEDRVEPEIISIKQITDTLIEMCGEIGPHTPYPVLESHIRLPQDTVPADELSGVIARLCAIEMAYSQDDRYAPIYRAAFPAGAAKVKDDLLGCFQSASGPDLRQEEVDIEALLRLQKLDAVLHQPGLSDAMLSEALLSYERAPVDLLRSARFGIIRHVLVARYLAAKARQQRTREQQATDGSQTSTQRSPIHTSSLDLAESALFFYAHAETVTRRRGAGGKLRSVAEKERLELQPLYPQARQPKPGSADPVPETDFKGFQAAINELIMRAITWRNRLEDEQVLELHDLLNPVDRYLDRRQR
ncbi:hypothetical protein AB0M12_40225 [Nocardia vinacea]|uniref:hypothetical protein n=1 Tax=Nocardia vinacea TaxID=96468 RepID=UPI003419227B